jgi:hypothetical protein
MDSLIRIVKRDTIPNLQSLDTAKGEGAGELRDFRWNDQLRAFMEGASDLSVGWVRLGPGELLQPRTLDVDLLMVVYQGSADIVGDLTRAVSAEDVVVVPSGAMHGFVGGPQGLYALAIQLGEKASLVEETGVTASDPEHTLQGLLEYNSSRLGEFQQRAIFELAADGTLNDPRCRATYRDGLRLWASQSSGLLTVRQACCIDGKYAPAFLAELVLEWSRGMPLDPALTRVSTPVARDPILIALADWFTRQMYLLDNVEKVALVDLVVASANAALGRNEQECRLWSHGYGEHAAATSLLLRGETPHTYARLRSLVAEAWDMVGALTDRLVELTRASRPR